MSGFFIVSRPLRVYNKFMPVVDLPPLHIHSKDDTIPAHKYRLDFKPHDHEWKYSITTDGAVYVRCVVADCIATMNATEILRRLNEAEK